MWVGGGPPPGLRGCSKEILQPKSHQLPPVLGFNTSPVYIVLVSSDVPWSKTT